MNMLNEVHRRALALMSGSNRATPTDIAKGKTWFAAKRACACLRSDELGQSLLEFALVLPIFMLMITGVLVLGLTVNNQTQLQTVVDQGAQAVAINQGLVSDPCGTALTIMQNATTLTWSSMTITVLKGDRNSTDSITGGSCSGLTSGTPVTVTATYPCSLAHIFSFAGSSCTLTASETDSVPY